MADIIDHDAVSVPPEGTDAAAGTGEERAGPPATPVPASEQAALTRYQQMQEARLAAERRAAAAEQRASMLEQGYRRGPEPEQAAPKPPPKSEEFTSHEDFVDAMVRYRLGQELPVVQKQLEERQARQQEEQQLSARQQHIAEMETRWRVDHPDYDQALDAVQAGMTPALQWGLMHSDEAPALVTHLAQHPGDLRRIASLPPHQIARELGRLEGRLTPAPAAAPAPAAKPTPPQVVQAARGSATVPGYRDDMTPHEYEQFRRQTSTWYKR